MWCSVVRQKPDSIFAGTSRIVLALKRATTAMPIVGIMADPVAGGIVESLGRPGGNITGVSYDAGIEILEKQLELLKELLPQASSVGYLASRGIWESPYGVATRESACGTCAERGIGSGFAHEILLATSPGTRPGAQTLLIHCNLRYRKINEEVKNNRYRETRQESARTPTGRKIGGNALV